MEVLNPRERELVALGAALASNCVPCVTYHIPKAKKAGLTDAQIAEAIELAEKVRQVPARAVLEAAQRVLPSDAVVPADCGCGTDKPGSCCP
jgi:AhpD family alkylhydroperoxidase